MIIPRLLLRLSLKKSSNAWHYPRENCHKNDKMREREGNPERKSERKRKERNKERKKDRERVNERVRCQKKGKCRKQGTTGWISLIEFARCANGLDSICFVCTKFHELWCMVPGYRFWGGLSLYSVSCSSLTKNLSNTKVVFNQFDRDYENPCAHSCKVNIICMI